MLKPVNAGNQNLQIIAQTKPLKCRKIPSTAVTQTSGSMQSRQVPEEPHS